MNKIYEIADAWIRAANPSDDEKKHAEHRYSICEGCEHRKKLLGAEICGKCGCPLSKKIFSSKMSETCPMGLWDEIDKDYKKNILSKKATSFI